MSLDQDAAPALLSKVDNVAAGYVHRDKLLRSARPVAAMGTVLKWYDLALEATPVPDAIHLSARQFLARQIDAGGVDVSKDLGFVILHRTGDFYFLIVSTWRNENELWETVYTKAAAQADFELFRAPGAHRGTYCVWELAAVWYEQQAWKRYLRSARDQDARSAYLRDCYDGLA